jgi:hypothetical protein
VQRGVVAHGHVAIDVDVAPKMDIRRNGRICTDDRPWAKNIIVEAHRGRWVNDHASVKPQRGRQCIESAPHRRARDGNDVPRCGVEIRQNLIATQDRPPGSQKIIGGWLCINKTEEPEGCLPARRFFDRVHCFNDVVKFSGKPSGTDDDQWD